MPSLSTIAVQQKRLSLLRELKRRKGLEDTHFFARNVCHYDDVTTGEEIGPRLPCKSDRGFHGELCEALDNEKWRRLLLLEPRGSLKSTISTIAFPLQQIVKHPNIRILLCSEEFMTAQKFMAEIVGHIESNPTFIDLYGDLKGKNPSKWNEKEITICTRTIKRKEPTITCAGIDVTKVGLHYDLIIIDDPHSSKNSQTREQIEKVITWYRLVLSLLDPGKRLIVIGTRWNYDDLFGWLIEKEREREQLGRKKRFHILRKAAVVGPLTDDTPNSQLLWPERLSKEFLQDTLLDQGPYIFSCQYRNEPVDDESATFKRSWIQFYDPKTLADKTLYTYATLDPVRDAESGDYAAISVVSFDTNWVGYIREIRRGKWDEYETLDNLINVCRIWKVKRVGVEAVAWQKLFYKFLHAELIRRGIKLPMTMLKTDTRTTKQMRIRSMTPYWKTGLFRVPGKSIPLLRGTMATFMDELLRFPRTKNDDCIDALAYIDQVSQRPSPAKIMRKIPVGSFYWEMMQQDKENRQVLGRENYR